MSSLAGYLEALNKIQHKSLFTPKIEKLKSSIKIGSIIFVPATRSQILRPANATQGLLIASLSNEERNYCQSRRLSYLTKDGHLYLSDHKYKILFEPIVPQARRSTKPSSAAPTLTPTTLISPNSFAIIDIIFRMSDSSLAAYPSALQFVKQHGVSQSKLSMLMRAMEAKSLVELKKNIRKINFDWWKIAFAYPASKKGLTPFFEVAQPYTSLKSQIPPNTALLEAAIVPGPPELAKAKGLLVDQNIYAWGTTNDLKGLKQRYQLVPGINKNGATWFLATAPHGVTREPILSRHPIQSAQNAAFSSNAMHAIWDMGFGEARIREIQMQLLEMFLNEI